MTSKEKQRIIEEKEIFDAIRNYGDFLYGQKVKVKIASIGLSPFWLLNNKTGKVIGIAKRGYLTTGVTGYYAGNLSDRKETWYYVDFGEKIERRGWREKDRILTNCGHYPELGKRLRNYLWINSTDLEDFYKQLEFNF